MRRARRRNASWFHSSDHNDPGERCPLWDCHSVACGWAGWEKQVSRMKNGFYLPGDTKKQLWKTGLALHARSKMLTWTVCPWSPCRRNLDIWERIAGSSAPFLSACSSPFWLNSSLHSEVWGCFFFPFLFKSSNNRKTSEAWCKLKFLSGVESRMIPR